MSEEKWEPFAGVPMRTMMDDKLTAEHFRVLIVIAAHDRFGRNNRHCDASHTKLARLAKCHLKSLSRSLRVLAERGYIEAAPNPLSRRQRAYRVVYLREDRAILKSSIGSEFVTEDEPDEDPIGNNAVPDEDPIGNNAVPDEDPIGNNDFQETEQNHDDVDHKRFCEAVRDSAEAVKINSAGAASPDGDTKDLLRMEGRKKDFPSSTGNLLGKIQTRLKSFEDRRISEDEADDLRKDMIFCEDLDEKHGLDGIGPWAQRLAIDIGDLLDNPAAEDEQPF